MARPELTPELASLLARLAAFLEAAETALIQGDPETIAASAAQWAQAGRDLRRIEALQWPSEEVRMTLLKPMISRVAALQQAIVRGQLRLQRELGALHALASATRMGADGVPPGPPEGLHGGSAVYDPTGHTRAAARSSGAYA